MIKLFTDTDTDITPQIAAEYGYNLISMPYNIDGKEVYPYIDFNEFDYKKFYGELRKGVMPSTAGLSPLKYIEYFEPHLVNGDDILYVHFSKEMSGTFNAMNIAIEELKEKYPKRNIYTIDTRSITINSYNIAIEIGKLFKNGKTIEEVLKWAQDEVMHFTTYFFAEDLKFFRKSGRVSNFSGIMGNIIGIKPIIYMDENGKMTNIGKCKGKKNAINKLVEYFDTLKKDIYDHKIIIGHTDAFDTAKLLGDTLQAKYENKLDIEYVVVNPTIGSHCGPDCIGISFYAIHK